MSIRYMMLMWCVFHDLAMSVQISDEPKIETTVEMSQLKLEPVDEEKQDIESKAETTEFKNESPFSLRGHKNNYRKASSAEMTQSLRVFLDKTAQSNPQETEAKMEHDVPDNSVESILLGNQSIIFATPFLEKYTKISVLCWNIANVLFEDMEALTHGIATGLIAYSGALQNSEQSTFASLAIQMGLIAHAMQKLSSFSSKVIPIREKQALGYQQMNRLNRNHASIHDLTILRLSASQDSVTDSEYSTKNLEKLYTFCAVFKNIAWDQLGVYVILLQTGTYSLVNWGNTMNNPKLKHRLLVYAIFCSIAGTFLQYYVKHLSKSVPKVEHKALLARVLNNPPVEKNRTEGHTEITHEQIQHHHGAENV